MDISCSLTKHQRNYGGLNVGDNVDRISKLPDEVLSHILSYLSTKAAVQTSILSKRWEYLWTSTSNLDFSDQFHFVHGNANDYIIKLISFKNYVDRVLFYHGGLIIRSCYLQCYTTHVAPNIYTWVYAVIMCNVQELILESSFDRVQELPSRLFSCKSLVVLKIKGMFVLEIPTYVCFPCLKILYVENVVYVDDASVERLFSSCSVLEDLAIRRRTWDGAQIMNISILSLKRLSILPNLYHADKYITKLKAPCLEYLELRGNSWDDYSVNLLSSLVEARISGRCVFELFNGISQVRHLVLTGDVMWGLQNIVENYDLPTFHNLKKMELYVGTPVNWELLPDLLDSSPNLETLIFPTGLVVPKALDFHPFIWHQPESVPECMLSHLKTVEIFNFVGLPAELYLIEFFLEYGEVLDRMTIHGYNYNGRPRMQKKMQGIQDEILSIPITSSTCKLVFTI